MSQKIVSFLEEKKRIQQESKKKKIKEKIKGKTNMLFLVIAIGVITGLVCWNYFVEDAAKLEVKIPASKNITYNSQLPTGMTAAQVANVFERFEGRPIFLYIYTTWCGTCKKTTPKLNEIFREFQNTDLAVMTLAIDRDMNPRALQDHLNQMGDLYFEPRFLAFKAGFKDFLSKRGIRYDNRIPYAVLISADGEKVKKISVSRSAKHIRHKIIKELYE